MTVPAEWVKNPSDELAIRQGCYFDAARGEHVCDFIERFCKQSKGRWAGQPIKLLDWQRDFLMRFFGWRRADGRRRFKRFYVEVAKKNGKSTLVSALVIYLLIADDNGPEVELLACDRNQASMIYDETTRMIRQSPELKRILGNQIVESRKVITFRQKDGRIRANSAEAPNKDGLNTSAAIFDELHRQPNRELWDVFEYAGASREEPIVGSITTAGESDEGVWYEQREYSEKVNAGEIEDTTHLGIVFRALPTDPVDDPATWRKANPSLGETISEADFARELAEAKQVPVKLNNFLRLRLNIIARENGLFLSPGQWKACEAGRRELIELRGHPCYVGIDLSSTSDFTSMVAVFGSASEGFDVFAWTYFPEENVPLVHKAHQRTYEQWIREGAITTTGGNVVDYDFIRKDFDDLAADHDVRMVGIDPWNATQFVNDLTAAGHPVKLVRQGFQSLNFPTKELERLVLSGKVHHGGEPVLAWCVGNAVAEQDAAGNVKLSKKKSRQKIDAAAALVNAIAAATEGDDGPSVYQDRGFLVL